MLLARRRQRRAEKASAEILEEVSSLIEANRRDPDLERERRILELRHEAGALMVGNADGYADQPSPNGSDLNGSLLPTVTPGELRAEAVAAAIRSRGALCVRGLLDKERARELADEIDRAFAAREAQRAGEPTPDGYYEEFEPQQPYPPIAERPWIEAGGGVLAVDSPRVAFKVFDTFDEVGLRHVITEYLGGRVTFSAHKSTLRKTAPQENGGWHQDGSFMGPVQALNVWVALTDCGVDAPGLDLVPRRLEDFVPTGTDDAMIDNQVSNRKAEEAAGDDGILRPEFAAGDAMLFDQMYLHRTAADPSMPNTRYAIESWFFSPGGFPGDYVPLAL